MARLKEGEHAIFIIRSAGMDSFKGSGFVRGGIYDTVSRCARTRTASPSATSTT